MKRQLDKRPMEALRLGFLGELKVMRGSEELALPPSRKTRALLAYLALSTRSFRREHLCELLWEIPDDPRGSLRWSLSKLRRLVDDEDHTRIVANRTHVSFEAGPSQVDVEELRGLVSNGMDQLCAQQLRAHADRLSGEFLEGLELPNFHEFYTWCIGQREQARRDQATLLAAVTTRLADTPDQALPYAQRLAAIAPYEEEAQAKLVQLLLTLDRHEEAQQQLRCSRRALEEAGISESGALQRALQPKSQPAGTAELPPASPASPRQAMEFARSTLVGRDREINEMINQYNDLSVDKRAQFFLLRGEPGIGKSRLLQAFVELTQQVDTFMLSADAYESEIVRPFALWNDAFRRREHGAATALFGGSDRIERDRLFAELNRIVCEEARQRVVVIIFDDLQWCDESSAAAIHYLLRMNREQPLYVLAGARDAELRDNQAMQQAIRGLRHEGLMNEIELGPLPEEAVSELILSQAPDADAEKLSRESGGNPLLAIELSRAELEGESGNSLTELVRERLSRLDEAAREVVFWAALLAPNIQVKTLERVTAMDIQELDSALESAAHHGMLAPAERGFRFSHDLITSSVYQEISPARRTVMHRRAAEQLEVDTALDLQLAADLAHHATRSGDPALAARAMVSAGRLCLRYYANDDALKLALSGLEFAATLPDAERVCLTIELSDIRVSAAPVENWEEAAREYVELAEQALDHGAMPFARLGYHLASTLRWIHGEWADARLDTLQAERVTRGASDEEHIIGMAETAKCLALLERDLSQADAMLMEANALATRGRISSPAISSASGMLRFYENKLDEAAELLQESRALNKALGDRVSEFQANEYLAMIEFERKDYAAASRFCQTLLQIAEKLRQGSELPFSRVFQALVHYAQTGEDQGLEEKISALREADAKHRLSYILNRLAFLEAEAGEFDLAIEHASEALSCSETLARNSEMIMARTALATACDALQKTVERDGHIDAMKILDQAGVARWARKQAAPFLFRGEKGAKDHD